jgi:RHS repeat-associated protein
MDFPGADNTALVDAVKLNGTLVSNGGFETPALSSGFVYNPSGATWTFTGSSGIAKNNSGFTISNPVAPEGTQVAFLQGNGRATHSLSLGAGSSTLSLRAAQRATNPSSQQFLVTIDGSAQLVQSTKQFIWNGTSMAEERDASNNVTRRFYSEGEQISGGNYYYTRDHLGSIREMAGAGGAIRAQYDYNVFGVRVKLQGDQDASFGFTGHYYHAPSGLCLTLYRAYDPNTNRWLSRDPIGEAGGLNLYAYVGNNPTSDFDPLGLTSYLITLNPDAKLAPHTAIWIVDSSGSTFYTFDSGGLHRIDNPSPFLADEVVAHRYGAIDQLDPGPRRRPSATGLLRRSPEARPKVRARRCV